MAISSTFVTGQVFTAADANLMANSGLVYVTSTALSATPAASTTVSNCFNSTYDNYVITMTNVVYSSGALIVALNLTSVTSGYYGTQFYDLYTGASTGYNRMNNLGYWDIAISSTDAATSSTTTIYSPNKTSIKLMTSQYYGGGYTGYASGQTTDAGARTGFTVGPTTGTMNSGTITVYGYRKA